MNSRLFCESMLLAIPKFSRKLGQVLNDHVKIGHLTKYDAVRVSRDQVMNFEIQFKIHTSISNFETASPKTIFKIFMISAILLKMGKHSDFHLSFFQIIGA